MVDTLYSIFGQRFQVASGIGDKVHPAAKQKAFHCPVSCKAFIMREIKANTRYWRYFLQSHYSMQGSQHLLTIHQVLDAVVELILRERIRFYELPDIRETIMLHNGQGTGYNFIKGPEPLPRSDDFPLEINSEEQAYEIINSLTVDNGFWSDHLEKHELVPEQNQIDARKSYQTDIKSYVAGLMVSGDLLIYSRAYAPPPPAHEVSLNYAPEFFVEKRATSGPEKESYESVVVDFQIDVDVQKNRNDVITLTHNESGYESGIVISDLWEFDRDWVRLSYADPPPTGTYTLVHNPKDGEAPYVIFEDVPYASLKKLSPDAEDVVIHDDEDDEENAEQSESAPA